MLKSPNTHGSLVDSSRTDHGPAVLVTAYILLIVTSLSTSLRLVDVFRKKRPFNAADGLVVSVSALAVVQSICVHFATRHGLGQHMSAIPPDELPSMYKYLYTSQLLAVVIETCAKISVIRFVCILSPFNPRHKQNLRWTSTAVITACGVFSFLATALQCGMPDPWVYAPQRCSKYAVWYTVTGLDIITDFYFSLFFIPTVWRLQLKLTMRVSVAGFFLSRLLTCASGAGKLVALKSAVTSSDQPWSQVLVIGTEQLLMSLSIVTANLPALKNFIYGLSPGQNMSVSDTSSNERLSAYFATVSSPAQGPKFIDRVLRRDEMQHNEVRQEEGITRTYEIVLGSHTRHSEDAYIAHGVPRSGVFEHDREPPPD